MPKLATLARIALPIIMIAIAYLSLKPADPDPEGGFALLRMMAAFLFGDPSMQDKIGHFLAYGAVAGAAVLALPLRPVWQIAATSLLYGGLFEILQSAMPDRYASFYDLLANACGITTGIVSALLLFRLMKSFRPWPAR